MKKAYMYIYPASPESKLQLLELRFAAATHTHYIPGCRLLGSAHVDEPLAAAAALDAGDHR